MKNVLSPEQILGFIAVVLVVLSYQAADPRRAILIQVLSQAIFSIHLFWLGAATGAIQVFAAAARDAFAVRATVKWLLVVSAGYLVLAWINAAITAGQWLDIAPAVATSFMTVTLFLRDRPFTFRCLSLLGVWLWLAYFVAEGSGPGVVQSILLTGSILISMLRHDRGVIHGLPRI